MTLQIFWPKPGNPREGGQKGGTNGREGGGGGGGEGGSRAKPGNQLVPYITGHSLDCCRLDGRGILAYMLCYDVLRFCLFTNN